MPPIPLLKTITPPTDVVYEPRCFTEKKLPNRWLHIKDWWNEIIIDDKRYIFSRRDIVMIAADQDGGAHVDEGCIDEKVVGTTFLQHVKL